MAGIIRIERLRLILALPSQARYLSVVPWLVVLTNLVLTQNDHVQDYAVSRFSLGPRIFLPSSTRRRPCHFRDTFLPVVDRWVNDLRGPLASLYLHIQCIPAQFRAGKAEAQNDQRQEDRREHDCAYLRFCADFENATGHVQQQSQDYATRPGDENSE